MYHVRGEIKKLIVSCFESMMKCNDEWITDDG